MSSRDINQKQEKLRQMHNNPEVIIHKYLILVLWWIAVSMLLEVDHQEIHNSIKIHK